MDDCADERGLRARGGGRTFSGIDYMAKVEADGGRVMV